MKIFIRGQNATANGAGQRSKFTGLAIHARPEEIKSKAPTYGPQATGVISARKAMSNQSLASRLAGSPFFREFQRAFEVATALPITLRPVESQPWTPAPSRNRNGFCALLTRTDDSCAGCWQRQPGVCEGMKGGPGQLSCRYGLHQTSVGVKIGGEIVACLQTGMVFFKPPTAQHARRALKHIREWGPGFDQHEAARLYGAAPVVCQRVYLARVKLLQFFADQLGALANQIILLQQNVEPLQITHARELIQAQYQEDVPLAMISKQVGMGLFYFCKQFKTATGVNYTSYVSRVRIEKAKNLLLNLNYRISEIAFEVGFKSLTHFNRLFRRIVGESPTKYREHLQNE
jgi:AraC-like DNA-binding protein